MGRYPPGPGTPPWDQIHPLDQVHTPRDQVHPLPQDHLHPPPGTRYTPLGPGTSPWTWYTPDQVHPRPGTPPGTRYTLQTRYTPFDQVHPPGTRYTPRTRFTPWTRYTPQEQCMLGDTGNKRAVRILLECILVVLIFSQTSYDKSVTVRSLQKLVSSSVLIFWTLDDTFLNQGVFVNNDGR